MKRSHTLPFAMILAAGASSISFGSIAADQDSKAPGNPAATQATPHQDMTQMSMANMSGMHEMPGTVLSVDHKSGLVEVESEHMKLKVHFPSNTIADLKKGDKINLHLGYSKQ